MMEWKVSRDSRSKLPGERDRLILINVLTFYKDKNNVWLILDELSPVLKHTLKSWHIIENSNKMMKVKTNQNTKTATDNETRFAGMFHNL